MKIKKKKGESQEDYRKRYQKAYQDEYKKQGLRSIARSKTYRRAKGEVIERGKKEKYDKFSK